MLHGYLSNKESFYYQVRALEQHGYCAVAPDMPAFGASSPITCAWSVGDYAKWLKDFIVAEGIYGCSVIAHSFGARVIFKLLAEDNGIADKLIITGGAGLVKPRSPEYMRQVKRYRRLKKLFPKYAERHFGSEEYRTLSPVMKESYKLIVNEDLRGCAEKTEVPSLLVYGSRDTVTPPNEEGEIFHSLIKASRLEIIDGGHFCFSENSAAFNSLMLEFLNA
ncbi:MAG: alpha/beta hydrolase [Clostridia bacterium]|nr:alpha/beta hydrolase [Clostridia bacterium]MDE7083818.1 alpha/beta hydrolase [Clostridia bacterium]